MAGRFTKDKRGQCVWEETLCCGDQGQLSGRYNWYIAPHHHGFFSHSGIHPPMVWGFELGYQGCYNAGNPPRNQNEPTYGVYGVPLAKEPGQDLYFQKYPRYGPGRPRNSYNPYCGIRLKCDLCKPDPKANRAHEGYWTFVKEGKYYDPGSGWENEILDNSIGGRTDRAIPTDYQPGIGQWGGNHYCNNPIPTVLDDKIFKKAPPDCEYRGRPTEGPHIVHFTANPNIVDLSHAPALMACGNDDFMWRRGGYTPQVLRYGGGNIDGFGYGDNNSFTFVIFI